MIPFEETRKAMLAVPGSRQTKGWVFSPTKNGVGVLSPDGDAWTAPAPQDAVPSIIDSLDLLATIDPQSLKRTLNEKALGAPWPPLTTALKSSASQPTTLPGVRSSRE